MFIFVLRVGESVSIRVDVKDGRRKQLSQGGDDIRVFMEEPAKYASAACDVTDLGNGSYLATFPLLWSGKVTIKASLTYNKEYLHAYHKVHNVIKSHPPSAAVFKTSTASEATLCYPYPVLQTTYGRLCNLTYMNGGLEWYCGYPRNPTLTCKHWTMTLRVGWVGPLPFTKAESTLNSQMNKSNKLRTLLNIININIESNKSYKPQVRKPQKLKEFNTLSWREKAPRGYFMNKKWQPNNFTMPKFRRSDLQTCLKDTNVYILGDSNV